MDKTVLGKFDRIIILNKNNKKIVSLNEEDIPSILYAPLQEVKNLGKVDGETLTKEEYEFVARF